MVPNEYVANLVSDFRKLASILKSEFEADSMMLFLNLVIVNFLALFRVDALLRSKNVPVSATKTLWTELLLLMNFTIVDAFVIREIRLTIL